MTPDSTWLGEGQRSEQRVPDGRVKEVRQQDLTSGWIVSSFRFYPLGRRFGESGAVGRRVRRVVIAVAAGWRPVAGSFAGFVSKVDGGGARIDWSRYRPFTHPGQRRRLASGIGYIPGRSFQWARVRHGDPDAFIRTATVDVDPVDVWLWRHLMEVKSLVNSVWKNYSNQCGLITVGRDPTSEWRRSSDTGTLLPTCVPMRMVRGRPRWASRSTLPVLPW